MSTREIIPCPGLSRRDGAPVFVDAMGRSHDLTNERTMRPKEAAGDLRLGGVSAWKVRQMVKTGELYPAMKLNHRVIWIFDCALTDWRTRTLRGSAAA